MLYSIQEAANQLTVTRMTIYKKIESIKGFSKYIKVQDGIKYIDEAGIDTLRKSIKKLKNDSGNYVDTEENTNDIHEDLNDIHINFNEDTSKNIQESVSTDSVEFDRYTKLQNKFNDNLHMQISDLKNQLNVKDAQIQSLQEEIGHQRQLHQNTQVLLRQMQDKVFLLEGEVPQVPQQEQKNKKSLWKFWKN